MFKALRQYIVDEAVPRWFTILVTPESALSLGVFGAFIALGDRLFSKYPTVGDLTTGLIAYAAIALGFCVAGLTIALTLPDRKFAVMLATIPRDGCQTNAYSDLLFVFSWTAVAHWIAVLSLFSVVLFADSSSALLPVGHSTVRILVVATLAALCAYCLCQFLITLITLSQVGNTYIRFLSKSQGPDSS